MSSTRLVSFSFLYRKYFVVYVLSFALRTVCAVIESKEQIFVLCSSEQLPQKYSLLEEVLFNMIKSLTFRTLRCLKYLTIRSFLKVRNRCCFFLEALWPSQRSSSVQQFVCLVIEEIFLPTLKSKFEKLLKLSTLI